MNSNDSIYGLRSNGGLHGDVYTSPDVVRFMLDKVCYTEDRDLSFVRILEPSCGDGEFVGLNRGAGVIFQLTSQRECLGSGCSIRISVGSEEELAFYSIIADSLICEIRSRDGLDGHICEIHVRQSDIQRDADIRTRAETCSFVIHIDNGFCGSVGVGDLHDAGSTVAARVPSSVSLGTSAAATVVDTRIADRLAA